ncbi:cystinosin [Pseudomassariella vexata]|uniref:Cystinosin n=1 Tax=Pseudomassariella vexata TaxID=1141098 RepID=A0A1Y2EJQ9_9PEZI|nr:cystinosin [Pseudomassariella vexata]ORY71802.1 cystinosin [Pseudomassariella vexata]
MQLLEGLSYLFGWLYTIAWSCSFYGQPMLNYSRKSTSGTTVDFPFINTFGFTAYVVSNAAFYWSPVIRAQYAQRNHNLTPTVTFNDVVFAGHGLLLCIITTSQYFFPRVWGFDRSPGTKPSRSMLGVGCGSIFAVLVLIFMVIGSYPATSDPQTSWAWLDVVYMISYVKLLVTLIKYFPQLVYNFRNQSTKGWSISQILLDFTGGVLSIAQQSIDSWLLRDWSGITGNPAKFALGNISMIYDVCFITQHFVLYKEADDSGPKDRERDALLESGEGNANENARRLD